MSGQQPAFPESLDEILNVVKETPRGRWFLEAYTNRVQTGGTSTILSAIAKLETSLQSMSGSGADAALLQKARQHIAQARADIVNSEQGKTTLSSEGQLFAKLADLSKKAFSDTANPEPAIAKNVERVLRLVADLDQDLGTSLVPMPVAAPKPAAQYFKQDDDVFEPAPAPVAIKHVKPTKPVEPASRGAKLVIQHIDPIKTEASGATLAEAPKAEIIEPIAITTTAVEAATPEPSRIVIIRKKAEDLIEVPLIDEPAVEPEAQVSAA
jgi:hypothetical protein